MIRIVLADDHIIFREGLSAMLASAGDIVIEGQASEGREALELISRKVPEVAVLDISMPGMDGLQLAAAVSTGCPETKVVMLTMHNNPVTAAKALKNGISGYVLKDNAFHDLLYAIRTAASGGTFVSPSLAGSLLGAGSGKGAKESPLSGREKEVLSLIAAGLTNKRIGDKLCISVKTVGTHRMRIMQKLDLHNTADMVLYAVKQGLAGD